MMDLAKADIGEIYNYILNNGQLEDAVAIRKSARLGFISFAEIDARTLKSVLSVIENMGDHNRDKARFMLDVCALNLLRKRDITDSRHMVSIDVHLGTLMKTAFRTRYLVVLADFVSNYGKNILLNIKDVPASVNTTRICDLLRYLIPILDHVSMQITAQNILAQELPKISVRYFVLTVEELSWINQAERRNIILGRMSKLPDYNKEIIVRDIKRNIVKRQPAKQEVVEQEEDAFYL